MTKPTESSIEVRSAVKWWLDKIGEESSDHETMSLFSLSENSKAERLLASTIVDCVQRSWREGNYWWGTELRTFGTSPRLSDGRNLILQVLDPVGLAINVTNWPEGAVMHVDPGRVFVDINGQKELVYGYWNEHQGG